MKKLLLLAVVSAAFGGTAFATEPPAKPMECCCEKMKKDGKECCPEKDKEQAEDHSDHTIPAPKG